MYKVSEELLKEIKELLSYITVSNRITHSMEEKADKIIGILKDEYYVK